MGQIRRIVFQVHLWLGLALGLYVFVVSLTGSLIVFRRELDQALCPPTLVVMPSGRNIVSLCEPTYISFIAELHDYLAGGRTGLLVNGAGAITVLIMCLSGAVIWWPGRTRWRRSTVLRRGVSGRRFIKDLHNVLGFWLLPPVVIWAATALYFAFPGLFDAFSDDATSWLARLHFGRAFGIPVEALWVVLGLAPCGLFITGALMWWNRTAAARAAAPSDHRSCHQAD